MCAPGADQAYKKGKYDRFTIDRASRTGVSGWYGSNKSFRQFHHGVVVPGVGCNWRSYIPAMIDYFTGLFTDPDFPGLWFVSILPYLIFMEWKYAVWSTVVIVVFYFNQDIEWMWPYLILVMVYVLERLYYVFNSFGGKKDGI